MTDYRLILRLLLRGQSYRHIQTQARCSHRTIAKAKTVATNRNLTQLADLDDYSDEQINAWFVDGRRTITEDFLTPDFDAIIHARRFDAQPTLKQLWLNSLQPRSRQRYPPLRLRQIPGTGYRSHHQP